MATLEQIKAPVRQELKAFQQVWDAALTTANPTLQHITDHLRQSTGKQMRPTLTLLSASLAGGDTDATLHAAASLELLHVASLIHDDVVDESPMRRGQPSVASAFSNKAAVLSGDFLLATALKEAAHTQSIACVDAVATLGRDLSTGELMQMESAGHPSFDESTYLDIITHKTAVLFATCAELGAMTGRQTQPSTTALLRRLGLQIGILFQMQDDCFDFLPENETGKPSGQDLREHKATLPLIYAYHNADKAGQERIRRALDGGEVEWLQQQVQEQGGLAYTRQRIGALVESTLTQIGQLPLSDYRTALESYIRFAGQRQK